LKLKLHKEDSVWKLVTKIEIDVDDKVVIKIIIYLYREIDVDDNKIDINSIIIIFKRII